MEYVELANTRVEPDTEYETIMKTYQELNRMDLMVQRFVEVKSAEVAMMENKQKQDTVALRNAALDQFVFDVKKAIPKAYVRYVVHNYDKQLIALKMDTHPIHYPMCLWSLTSIEKTLKDKGYSVIVDRHTWTARLRFMQVIEQPNEPKPKPRCRKWWNFIWN